MTYIEALKNGFHLVNRNWQLVLLQLGVVFISSIGFFVIVGLPLAVAFIIFGIDLTGFTNIREIFDVLRQPSDILSKYFGLLLLVLASFVLYISMVALLGIFVFGGAVGLIGRSIADQSLYFSFRIFLNEAKRLFLHLVGFTSIMGVVFLVIAFFLGILGGGLGTLISYAQTKESTIAFFFVTFFSLILLTVALSLILGILSVTVYGIAVLFFKDTGPLKSVKEALAYLKRQPSAFWFYAILFVGYLLASFLLMLLSYPFTLIPIIGPILSFPYQFLYYAFETYLGLIIIAGILSYYHSTEVDDDSVSATEVPASPTVEQLHETAEGEEESKQ